MTNARHLIWLGSIALVLSGCTDRSTASAPSPLAGEGRGEGSLTTATQSEIPNLKSQISSALPTANGPVTNDQGPETKDSPGATAGLSSSAAVRDITFDTIKFDMRKEDPFVRSMLTPAIERLDGTRIRIRGYILPSFQQSGLAQFVLVRDNMECCFGPGAALFDCIVVEMTPGRTTEFTTRPVAVEGEFSIREILGPDERPVAIYHLAGERVQ